MLVNEQTIVEEAKTDPSAFGTLFDAYYDKIYTYICRRVASTEVAEDLSAETFMKAYKNIHSFKWRGHSILNWLYMIAGNEIKMHFRKNPQKYESLEEQYEINGYEPVSDIDIQQSLVDEETRNDWHKLYVQTRNAMLSLRVKYQEVLHLHYIENVGIADIAIILGKKEGTVKSLLHRGRKLLYQATTKDMQPENMSRIIPIGGAQLINSEEQL